MKQAILCVDDESIIVLSLKQELRSHYKDRFIYETALNAAEALTILDDLAAEGIGVIVIISDWLMPGLRGDEFLLQASERYPGVKYLVVTGQAEKQSLDSLKRESGFGGVLDKPWTAGELIGAVDRCLDALGR